MGAPVSRAKNIPQRPEIVAPGVFFLSTTNGWHSRFLEMFRYVLWRLCVQWQIAGDLWTENRLLPIVSLSANAFMTGNFGSCDISSFDSHQARSGSGPCLHNATTASMESWVFR
jgi:hypothetical protein